MWLQVLLVDAPSLEFHCVTQFQDRSRDVNGTFMSGGIMSSSYRDDLVAKPGGLRLDWDLDQGFQNCTRWSVAYAVAVTIGVLQPGVVWIAGRVVPPRPAPAGGAG